MSGNYVGFIQLKNFNTTGLTTSFKPINASGFPDAVSYVRIVNNSNRDIEISFDGTNSHAWIKAGQPWIRNFQATAVPQGFTKLVRAGSIVHVKGASAGTGLVFLESSS